MNLLATSQSFFGVVLLVVVAIAISTFSVVEARQLRIVGGDQAEPGDYPYFVELNGCAGTLVAPDIVLTAAHCNNLTDQQVSVGSYRTKTTYKGARGRFCEEWIPDPLHRVGAPSNNDFALCKLDKPIDIYDENSRVRLELNEDSSVPSDMEDLIVMGFGWLDTDQNTPDELQRVIVPSVNNTLCESAWGTSLFTENMMCAGYWETGGKDACRGDSGGPLVKRTVKNDGTIVDTHVGVVSFGVPCAFAEAPTVYARTTSRMDWIKDTMCNTFKSVAPFCDNPPLPSSVCDSESEELIIRFQTDSYGKESSWTLADSFNNPIKTRQYLINNLEYEHKLCLKKEECYTWELLDVYGDGMCSSRSCGSYTFTLDGEVIIEGDGNFDDKRAETFCTEITPPISDIGDGGSTPEYAPLVEEGLDSEPPSNFPSFAPSEAPSESPSKSPSHSLSEAPSFSPSDLTENQSFICVDDKDFRWKNRRKQTCSQFLRQKRVNAVRKKCRKIWDDIPVSEWCPETCGRKGKTGPCV